eukprot:491340-Amphidinium_carterae.1
MNINCISCKGVLNHPLRRRGSHSVVSSSTCIMRGAKAKDVNRPNQVPLAPLRVRSAAVVATRCELCHREVVLTSSPVLAALPQVMNNSSIVGVFESHVQRHGNAQQGCKTRVTELGNRPINWASSLGHLGNRRLQEAAGTAGAAIRKEGTFTWQIIPVVPKTQQSYQHAIGPSEEFPPLVETPTLTELGE